MPHGCTSTEAASAPSQGLDEWFCFGLMTHLGKIHRDAAGLPQSLQFRCRSSVVWEGLLTEPFGSLVFIGECQLFLLEFGRKTTFPVSLPMQNSLEPCCPAESSSKPHTYWFSISSECSEWGEITDNARKGFFLFFPQFISFQAAPLPRWHTGKESRAVGAAHSREPSPQLLKPHSLHPMAAATTPKDRSQISCRPRATVGHSSKRTPLLVTAHPSPLICPPFLSRSCFSPSDWQFPHTVQQAGELSLILGC